MRPRTDFASASLRHLVDAQILFDANRWANSYYLAGYVLECGRKALCFAGFEEGHGRFSKKIGHRFDDVSDQVIDLIGLFSPYAARYNGPAKDWQTKFPSLSGWDPNRRYESATSVNRADAVNLLADARKAFDYSVGRLWADGVAEAAF